MKLLPAFFAVVLGSLAAAHGQSEAKLSKVKADPIISLTMGPLVGVVNEIEELIPRWPGTEEGTAWVMPNTLFSKEAQDAVVPGHLRLRGVSPLEAVAFAAAAAGCSLEPILVPTETPNGASQRVAGYRIEVDRSATRAGTNRSTTLSNAATLDLEKSNSTVAHSGTPPAPRTVTLHGGRLDMSSGSSGGGTLKESGPAKALAQSQEEARRPFVRVNGLGSFLSGSEKEVEEKKHRLSALFELALMTAGSDGSALPELSFHLDTRTLIAKGTAAQHEIIEQVLRALKENESVTPAPAKP